MALLEVLELYQVRKQQPGDQMFQVATIYMFVTTVNLRYWLFMLVHPQVAQGCCHL